MNRGGCNIKPPQLKPRGNRPPLQGNDWTNGSGTVEFKPRAFQPELFTLAFFFLFPPHFTINHIQLPLTQWTRPFEV
uniref:Uncharacterized protein n=1 Tax=Bracon brevicornis TaxID=1563983 RepID=A0A6V7LN95_9HYME